MATVPAYPSSFTTLFTEKVDEVDRVRAAHMNQVQAEILAAQQAIGLNPGVHGSVTNADLNSRLLDMVSTIGAWTSWTPSWTSAGAEQPVGADGTKSGAYIQIGKLVIARFKLTMSRVPTTDGNWRFSYPVPIASSCVGTAIGTLIARDSSGTQSYACMPYAFSSSYFLATLGQTLKITSGQETLTFTSDTTKDRNGINFGVTYKAAPVVSTSCGQTALYSQWENVTTTDFDGQLRVSDGGTTSGDKTLKWRAVGMVESNADDNTPFAWALDDVLGGILMYEAA
jgi:hypothetical protein